MKVCTKCKEEKQLCEFYKYKKSKDGLSHICKICDNEKNRKWKKENQEKVKEQSRKWYKENTEKDKEQSRKWYKENTEKIIECRKNLKNAYVKKLLTRDSILTFKEIPDWLVEIKREEIKLKRLIKEKKS